jgi:hypothetical protein
VLFVSGGVRAQSVGYFTLGWAISWLVRIWGWADGFFLWSWFGLSFFCSLLRVPGYFVIVRDHSADWRARILRVRRRRIFRILRACDICVVVLCSTGSVYVMFCHVFFGGL